MWAIIFHGVAHSCRSPSHPMAALKGEMAQQGATDLAYDSKDTRPAHEPPGHLWNISDHHIILFPWALSLLFFSSHIFFPSTVSKLRVFFGPTLFLLFMSPQRFYLVTDTSPSCEWLKKKRQMWNLRSKFKIGFKPLIILLLSDERIALSETNAGDFSSA